MSVETRLATWLEETTPEPPRTVTVEDVVPLVRRRRTRWQPLLAAALVLVLAGVAVAVVARSKHQPAAPVATHVITSSSTAPPSPSPSLRSLAASPHTRAPSLAGLPWRPAYFSGLQFSARLDNALLADGSGLVSYDAQTGMLTRIDVVSGRTLARRTALRSTDRAAAAPVLTGGQIWLAAQVGPNAVRVAGYDAHTLQPRHQVTLRGIHFDPASLVVIAASGDAVYVGAGTEVVAISARSGRRTGGWSIDATTTGIDGIAAAGGKVYVGVDNGGGSGSLLTYRAEPAATSNEPLAQQADAFHPIAASGSGLWVSVSGGNSTSVLFHGTPTTSVGGGNGSVGMTISGSAAWLTSPPGVVCADPSTGRVRARVAVDQSHGTSSWLGKIAVVQNRTFAIATIEDSVHGEVDQLVELHPPATCR